MGKTSQTKLKVREAIHCVATNTSPKPLFGIEKQG
jgi:hypothetical protein